MSSSPANDAVRLSSPSLVSPHYSSGTEVRSVPASWLFSLPLFGFLIGDLVLRGALLSTANTC